MEDKYLIFFFSAAIVIPVGAIVARNSKRALNLVFILLVFGTSQTDRLFGLPVAINFLSREWYRGSTRGIEITYLDFLSVILLIASRYWRRKEGIKNLTPPSYNYLKSYFLWCLATVILFSEPQIFGVFELTKMFRAMLLFLAAYAFIRSPEQIRLFIYVVLAISFYEAAFALYQRYGLGVHRVYASQPHANSLSTYCLQLLPITLSMCFAADLSRRLTRACQLATLLIAVTIILTISRTGFAAMVLLSFATILFNIRNRLSARNIGFLVLAILVGAAMTYRAWDSLSERFSTFNAKNEYLTQEGDRGSYFRKGWPALKDNPIAGIGLNNWSYWISNKYAAQAGYSADTYPSTDRPPSGRRQEAPAHNLFLLTAVEIGIVGLILLVALFLRWLYIAGHRLRSQQGDYFDQLRIGLFFSLMGVLLQSVTEWQVRQTSLFFFMHIVAAFSAYLYHSRVHRA